jgi:hypothetical protein
MKKYDVMGWEMVKLEDVCHAIRATRNDIDRLYSNEDKKEGMRDACEDIIRRIFIDEIRDATSPEEVDAILEMRGDFVVSKRDKDNSIIFFSAWDNGEAVTSRMAFKCMHFDYESKAREIAEKLGEGWIVVDTCQADYDEKKRLLNAIFGDEV